MTHCIAPIDGPAGSRTAMTRTSLLVGLLAVMSWLAWPAAATAATPNRDGPFIETYSFAVDCGDFEATVDGTLTIWLTVHFDQDGNVTWADQFVRAPYDVWVNSTTGASIVVRGEFQEKYTVIPGTDQITVTIRGFRYLVNEPGRRVILRDVGRIVYGEPTEETILTLAGQHDFADESQVEPLLCDALR